MHKDLKKFSKSIGFDEESLVKAFKIEKEFHDKISVERNFEKRQELYGWVYPLVHKIYGKDKKHNFDLSIKGKKRVAWLFKKELRGKSVLDIGCGDGAFLYAIKASYEHKHLCGVDLSQPALPDDGSGDGIEFVNANIVRFKLDKKYDVAMLDNVYEHISVFDKDDMLESIHSALTDKGKLILWLPHRMFGPSDVTRINDFSYSGSLPANGTHLNESTYGEVMADLEAHGFTNIKSLIPHRKIKYAFPWLRFPASIMRKLESTSIYIWLCKNIRYDGQCFLRYPILLVAQKA